MRILLTGLFLCLCITLKAQYTIAFMPEIQGRTMDGLYKVRIGNTGAKQNVSLVITVTEAKSGAIVTIKTPAFELMSGMNSTSPNAAYAATVGFGSSKLATIVSQGGFFPQGDYDYCFQLYDGTSHSSTLLAEQCFNYNLEPFSNMQLIQPYDGDKICDKRPSFSWQPLIPAVNGVMYRMLLVEVKEGQQRAEALRMNLAIINQQQIPLPILLYPSLANELVEGKQYAWQVSAYRNDLLLVESEIWDFKVDCERDSSRIPVEAFRNLEDLTKGNFYIARGQLLFAFNNTYEATTLQYSIRCLTKPDQQIKKLPKVKVSRGRNQVVIDISENSSFIDGYFYIMDVKLPDGDQKQLRFIYKLAENDK
ncbi:hypothetical protein SAMN05518672_103444 [Chitinophaga sp. CF118]|uniref:DUF928 domain-containing protein n=1 Tax=Chitinophaga sp. CF118 TaxID=1884367 RepID=UPI0008EFDED6|nr:DUF928 domain-containing protein [Chitinophaga sp. CF118]SFD83832.1 hypothetical protein SAMN05518672_103444 [Chitinophaga sp. CF118]